MGSMRSDESGTASKPTPEVEERSRFLKKAAQKLLFMLGMGVVAGPAHGPA
jgi:hypothetical protein